MPEVASVRVYGVSGRRYDLELALDASGPTSAAVTLDEGDAAARLTARLTNGRTWTRRAVGPPQWPFGPAASRADDEPRSTTARDLYLRALDAAGVRSGPGGGPAGLTALAQGPRARRDRAAEVLCAHLRRRAGDPTDDRADAGRLAAGARSRREAQRLLMTFLRGGDTRLDLTGARLVDLDAAGCRLDDVDFSGATFAGSTRFTGASFSSARFTEATFGAGVDLAHARIAGDAEFARVTVGGDATFDHLVVAGATDFTEAVFRADAEFTRAAFGSVDGRAATVVGHAVFHEATFTGDVALADTRVHGQVVLDGARVEPHDDRRRTWPAGWSVHDAIHPDGYRNVR